VDEAQRIKAPDSIVRGDLSTKLQWSHAVLLTGTPIQNSMAELWSLLNFLDKSAYDDDDVSTTAFA
jgi:SNF2 family DNA or RNA helicase